MPKKDKRYRAEFRKKHDAPPRQGDVTREFRGQKHNEDAARGQRMTGKGALTRKRTIQGGAAEAGETGFAVQLEVDPSCIAGRVLSVHGLVSNVLGEDGVLRKCAVRGLLKTLITQQRHVVAAGDHVMVRPMPGGEGAIERIEPRHGVLSRTSKGREHVIVANVDQLLIIASAAEPGIKPHLIDRMLVSAEKAGIEPIICVNKIDLADPASLQPLVGVYGQLGYRILLVSAATGFNIDRLRRLTAGRQSAVAGQSGVGKSSILNAIQPGLALRVQTVSEENQKGRHTTTTATLLPLEGGGFIVDTPGIRTYALWDVVPAEVAGYFRDLRPYVARCRFPDCTHQHEADCAVQDAVADNRLDLRRYESYCHMFAGEEE